MPVVSIYHNQKCSKSRKAKEILEGMDIDFNTIDYIKNGLTEREVLGLKNLLGIDIIDFTRTNEIEFKELGLIDANDEQLISALLKMPKLLQRPIVINGPKAIIARPAERIEELF